MKKHTLYSLLLLIGSIAAIAYAGADEGHPLPTSNGVVITPIAYGEPEGRMGYMKLKLENLGDEPISLNSFEKSKLNNILEIADKQDDSDHSVYGNYSQCKEGDRLAPHTNCLIALHRTQNSAKVAATDMISQNLSMTITTDDANSAGLKNHQISFYFKNYLAVVGAFTQIGSVSTNGRTIAICDPVAGSCIDGIPNLGGANGAIEIIVADLDGNVYLGGDFSTLGNLNVSGKGWLLAKCSNLGSNSSTCINPLTGSTPWANNVIEALAYTSNRLYVGGRFNAIGNASIKTSGTNRLLASCNTATGSCSNVLTGSSNYANDSINAITADNGGHLFVGGVFHAIGGFGPTNTTPVGVCDITNGTCQDAAPNLPGGNNTISTTATYTDTSGLYGLVGGIFTSFGGYNAGTGNYPIVQCPTGARGVSTNCRNALTGTVGANAAIAAITPLGGYIFVGGSFSSIGGVNVGSGKTALVQCTFGESCINVLTGTGTGSKPYANSTIFGIATLLTPQATVK